MQLFRLNVARSKTSFLIIQFNSISTSVFQPNMYIPGHGAWKISEPCPNRLPLQIAEKINDPVSLNGNRTQCKTLIYNTPTLRNILVAKGLKIFLKFLLLIFTSITIYILIEQQFTENNLSSYINSIYTKFQIIQNVLLTLNL